MPLEESNVSIVRSDDIDDLKVIKDVHFHSEISRVIEDTPIDSYLPILNEIHVSSASTVRKEELN